MPRLKQIGIDVEVNSVIERNRRSFSETENDILRRILLPFRATRSDTAKTNPRTSVEASTPKRSRGLWTVEILGQRVNAANLKDAYRTLLLHLNAAYPDFLEKFSKESARSRRFVARSPVDLYLKSAHLAKDHAKELMNGWFFDTNLSTEQVASRIRIAARLCGLRHGADVRILDALKEI